MTHIARLEEGAGEGAERDPAADAQGTRARLRVPQSRAQRAYRGRGARISTSAGERSLLDDATFALERGEHVALVGPNGSGKTTLLETHARPARARRRQGAPRSRRGGRVLLPAGGRAGRARIRARMRPGGDRAAATRRAEPPRALPLLGLGGAGEAGRRALGRRAATPRARARRRLGRELARPRRADEPPRPREPRGARGRAGGVSRHGPARLARPRVARRRSGADAGHRGRQAGLVRRRLGRLRPAARRAGGPPVPSSQAREGEGRAGPRSRSRGSRRELERIEAEIAERERAVAELEQKLSDDWTDVETLAAHRRAREELQSLLSRWEEVFERQLDRSFLPRERIHRERERRRSPRWILRPGCSASSSGYSSLPPIDRNRAARRPFPRNRSVPFGPARLSTSAARHSSS